MGEIIPFVARVRDSGDWTASERAKLAGLAERFAEAGQTVDVVYGVTDDGDPWCVVKDQNEDILLHVARIGGAFVVHYAAEDSVAEAPDLPAALGERLSLLDDADDHVVVPFAAGGRQAQMLIALVVATAFFYDTREAHAEDPPQDHALPAPDFAAAAAAMLVDTPAPRQDRDVALHGAAAGDATAEAPKAQAAASAAAEAAPAPAPTAEARSEPAAATAPEDAAPAQAAPAHAASAEPPGQLLTGSAGADVIHGGAGDDTLSGGGAPGGQFDVLDGGAGDDRILVTAQVIAIGGAGADTFVIEAPRVLGEAGQLLGVILDFRAAEGDRMIGRHGQPVTFVTAPDGVTARVQPPALPPSVTSTEMTQQFVDLNGDGRPDGFLLVGHGAPPEHAETPKGAPADEAGGMLPGETFVHALFG